MSYPLDKKNKRKKIQKMALFLVGVFLFIYFSSGIFDLFSGFFNFIFRPALISGEDVSERAQESMGFFRFKKSILEENKFLQGELDALSAKLANYNSILDENMKLREILGRKNDEVELVLGSIISKPNKSPYDTMLIDIGEKNGVVVGQTVLASGFVPIGRISEVFANSSKVVLFSSPGEKNEVAVSGRDIFLEAVGRGGGNFEMILSRELNLEPKTEILLPGVGSRVIGFVEATISDPRDAYNKVLVVSPVNIQELRFVQVEIR